MDKFKEILNEIWAIGFVRFVALLALAFIVGFIAKFFVAFLLRLVKLDKKLDKWGINDGKTGTSIKFVGNLAFLIGFLVFLPPAFEALNLQSVSTVIGDLAATVVGYIPNIIAAIIVLFVGFLIAGLVEQIVSVLLRKTKIDSLAKKAGSENDVQLSKIVGRILSVFIVLISVVQAILVLGIEAVSAPALSIINAVFGAIPSLLLAVIILAIGVILAKLVSVLLANLLAAVGFDKLVEKSLGKEIKFSPAKILIGIVRVVIILFCLAQAVAVLNFAILTDIMVALIGYLPLALKSAFIVVVAFFGAVIAEKLILKAMPDGKIIASAVKAGIYILAIFMVFTQLEIAKEIVVPAFIILLVAAGIAFAIAFGLGGQEFAKKVLGKKCEKKASDENAEPENKD